jgi:hypothetical protein
VAGFKALFEISTKFVNKYVDKHPLDTPEACTDAAYNNLPIEQAKSSVIQIKDLADAGGVLVRKLRR